MIGGLFFGNDAMSFFAMQYQILFHDTMAYGTHHHMVNLKFQDIARETILFESGVRGEEDWTGQLKDIVIFTREAYSRNLAPVGLGGKVAILLTYEEPSRSTFRLCFRVMNVQGQPVACGFQTMVLVHKDTNQLVLAPPLLTQYLDAESKRNLLERLTNPSFAERAKAGGVEIRHIFPEAVQAIGIKIAGAPRQSAYPRIIDDALREFPI
jgi:acyl-CoA thioesterase FadM